MKIYTMDCGWQGSIVVIANSKDEAIKLMENQPNYDIKNIIEESEIKKGWLFSNLGDL